MQKKIKVLTSLIIAKTRKFFQVVRSPRTFIDESVTNYLNTLGFLNINRYIVYGPKERISLGNTNPKNNTFFNTRSGYITIGDDTVFGYHCLFLTGVHLFENGKLKQPKSEQVPPQGYDIKIGKGCWIASGAIIIGGVTLGDDCIVAAGAVVTHSFPDGSIIGGVPAKLIGQTVDFPRRKQDKRVREGAEGQPLPSKSEMMMENS